MYAIFGSTIRSLFSLFGIFAITALLSIGHTAAQDDPNRPARLTNGEASGRWQTGEPFSRSYVFYAGSGEIRISYFFRVSRSSLNVCGQVVDDKGRAVDEQNALAERRTQTDYGFIYAMPSPTEQVVGRYVIKRRQKLTVRVYTCFSSGLEVPSGSYSIKVEGDGVTEVDEPTAAAGSGNTGVSAAGKDKPLTLAQILTGLQAVGSTPETKTLAARNHFIINECVRRNISFEMNGDREKDLRDAGASDKLLRTLKALSAIRGK